MATNLIVYNSSIQQSLAAAAVIADYAENGTDTITYKDLNGIAHGDIDTWLGTLSQVYTKIWLTVEAATNDVNGKFTTDQAFVLWETLLSAAQGTKENDTENATAADATSITDSGLTLTVDALIGDLLVIDGGTGASQLALIGDNTATKITIVGAQFSTTPDTTSDFATYTGSGLYMVGDIDTTNKKYPAQLAWELVNDIHMPTWIDMLSWSVLNAGTATAGANTTLTDSNHNTHQRSAAFGTDTYNDMYIAIYAGTGAGQVRKITDTAANVITVGVAWDTNPSTDSEYAIFNSLSDAFANQIAGLMTRVEFSDLDDPDVLNNFRRLVDWGKVNPDKTANADSGTINPLEDKEYLEELVAHGLSVYKYSIL